MYALAIYIHVAPFDQDVPVVCTMSGETSLTYIQISRKSMPIKH